MKKTSFLFFCYCTFIILVLQSTLWAEASQVSRCALKPPRAVGAVKVGLELVASGFDQPIYVTNAGDGSNRLFVVEKTGRIKVVDQRGSKDKPFLDIHDLVATKAELGLLSVAFHPKYSSNGRVFVFYSEKASESSVLAEYRVAKNRPDQVIPIEKRLFVLPQPEYPVHRGGQLMFGPDGYLYVSLGNGGVSPNGQDLTKLSGAILRLDVDHGDPYAIPPKNPFLDNSRVRPEIWAYGFRNPWRFSIDLCTGELFVGDVGNSLAEEINLVEPGGNYGYDLMEGDHCFVHPLEEDKLLRQLLSRVCAEAALELPIYLYRHLAQDPRGGEAVVGGFVYRGRAFPQLVGRYVFGDWTIGRIWTLTEVGSPDNSTWLAQEVFDADFAIPSFGVDEGGELYVVAFRGEIYRIVAE